MALDAHISDKRQKLWILDHPKSTVSFPNGCGWGGQKKGKTNSWVFFSAVGSSSPLSVVMVGSGCATESACNLNMTVLDFVNIRTFCSSGFPVFPTPSSAPDGLGLRSASISTVPVLISLLLLKVLVWSSRLRLSYSPTHTLGRLPSVRIKSQWLLDGFVFQH